MVAKQNSGFVAPDGSRYVTFTDGVGNLVNVTTSATGTPKPSKVFQSADGSLYVTVTDGAGNLV